MADYDAYMLAAQRTSRPVDKVKNGCLGLCCESGEVINVYKKWKMQTDDGAPFPTEKFVDELGDVMWYAAEFARGIGDSLSGILEDYDSNTDVFIDMPLFRLLFALYDAAGNVEKAVYDTAEMQIARINLRDIVSLVAVIAVSVGSDMDTVLEGNIAKLKKRYPGGFSAERSEHREEE